MHLQFHEIFLFFLISKFEWLNNESVKSLVHKLSIAPLIAILYFNFFF